MAADPLINLIRGLRRAVESYGREVQLSEGAGGGNGEATVGEQFMSGYDGAKTTLPFVSDVSIEGGDDIVVG